MTVMGNFSFFFLRLMWKFLEIFDARGSFICWPNIYIIDRVVLFSPIPPLCRLGVAVRNDGQEAVVNWVELLCSNCIRLFTSIHNEIRFPQQHVEKSAKRKLVEKITLNFVEK
jgi:hypothetical protein